MKKLMKELGILLCWFGVAVLLVLALFAFVRDVSAQNFSGGFRCETVTGSGGERVRALFRSDGHLAYYRPADGVFTRLQGCGGGSTDCSNAVRACFGVEIGIETPLGVISALDGASVGRTIFSGAAIWFALFVIGVFCVLIGRWRLFRGRR